MEVRRQARIGSILLILVAGMCPAFGNEPPLPSGWKPVDVNEWINEGPEWRRCEGKRTTQRPYTKATGDFDGDGRIDWARILVEGQGRAMETVLFVTHRPGNVLTHTMIEGAVPPGDNIQLISCIGVRRAWRESACSLVNVETCSHDEPGKPGETPGIVLFHIGWKGSSVNEDALLEPTYFAWDAKQARFVFTGPDLQPFQASPPPD